MADAHDWVLDLSSNPPRIYNSQDPGVRHNALQQPFPSIFWYINNTGDNITHDGELTYHSALIQPFPYLFWYSTGDDVVHDGTYMCEPMGACVRCTNLTTINIPQSVKKIGPNMATNTGLTSVTIASDCEYSSTSFPANCTVNFYPV